MVLLSKAAQPILTAEKQLLLFSSFSPAVSQLIISIDWMENLLTRLNQLKIKQGKEEKGQP